MGLLNNRGFLKSLKIKVLILKEVTFYNSKILELFNRPIIEIIDSKHSLMISLTGVSTRPQQTFATPLNGTRQI